MSFKFLLLVGAAALRSLGVPADSGRPSGGTRVEKRKGAVRINAKRRGNAAEQRQEERAENSVAARRVRDP